MAGQQFPNSSIPNVTVGISHFNTSNDSLNLDNDFTTASPQDELENPGTVASNRDLHLSILTALQGQRLGNKTFVEHFSQWEEFTDKQVDAVITVLFLIATISLIANSMALASYARSRRKLRVHPFMPIYISLALSDLICSVFGTWFKFFVTLLKMRMNHFHSLCHWYGFITFTSGMVSLLSITCLAVQHFLLVCKPFGFTSLTQRQSLTTLGIVWAFAIGWALLPVFGIGHYVPEGLGTWCSIDWLEPGATAKAFITASFGLCFLIPLFLIASSCIATWTRIYKMKKKNAERAQGSHEFNIEAELVAAKTTVIAVACFVTAWLPYAIIAMIAVYIDGDIFTPAITLIPSTFAKTSTCYNPIACLHLTKQFDKALSHQPTTEERPRDTALDQSTNPQEPMRFIQLEQVRLPSDAMRSQNANNSTSRRVGPGRNFGKESEQIDARSLDQRRVIHVAEAGKNNILVSLNN